MGRGEIISHIADGKYNVRLNYAYRSRITQRLAGYTAQLAALDAQIINPQTDQARVPILRLQRAAIQRMHDYYSNGMPADPTVEAWCADLTEDLAYGTVVGTVEIPGEQVTVLVRPAYNGRSIYSVARDGSLMPSIAGSPHQVLFNWMLLPGWQRHKPIYRTGTVSAIDYDANTCTVCIDPAFSSQQNLPAVDGVSVADCGATALSGAADFCSRYPTHPFCTNSEEGAEIELSTAQLAQLQTVNQDINLNYGRQGDPSGYRTGDSWDVMAPGGSGDCVACYEEIYTSEGIKSVGDLQTGDMVLSYDFEKKEFCYKPIVKIWEKGELPGVRVGLKNGHHIDITENHPLWVRSNQSRGRDGKGLRKYEKVYFKDIDLTRYWKRRLPIAVKVPYTVKDVEWLNDDLCLISGHFIAEGWVEKGGHKVQSSGYELTDHIFPLLNKNSIPFSEYVNNSGVPCIRFLKGKFKDFLKTLKSNSFDIHLPEFIFALPENKLKSFLYGFYLGDGHNGNYNESYSYESHKAEVYSSSSEQFAYDIQRIGLQIGTSFNLWKQERHGGSGMRPIYRTTHNTKSVFYRDHGYQGLSEVGIARNRIENIGPVKMRDFEVKDTHTFVFKNGLIAHQCEDFALTKMQKLVDDYGWSPANLKLVTGYTKTGEYHAMLGVRTSNRGLMILDVNNDPVVASTKLPYRIDKIAMTATSWKNYTRQLAAVPVEYMSCNAAAFAPGDSVVVEFTGQSWSTPKVVGFVENPQSCTMDALILGNVNYNNPGYSFYKYGFDADQWQIMGEIPGHKYYGSEGWILRGYMFTSSSGSNAFIFGGIDNVYNPYDPLETTPIPECASPPGCFNSIYADANKYSQSGGTWTNLQDMPEGRAYGQGFKIGTKHYVVAGSTFHVSGPSYLMSGSPKNSNFEYDEIALTWATKQGCPSSRQNSRGWMINNIGFTFGGRDTNFTSQFVAPNFPKGLHGYNQITDAWASYQDMLRGRNNMAAGKINGDGYVFPGYAMEGESGDCALYSETPGAGLFTTRWLDKYNEASNSWSMVSNLFSSTDFSYSAGIAECGYYGLWYFFNSGPFGSLVNWADYNALTSAASFRSGNPSEVGQFGQESKSFIGV